MNKMMLFGLLTLLFPTSVYCGTIYTNYVNGEKFPVKITVPYYSSKSNHPRPIQIELQEGDLYEARSGKNGIIYPKYASLPNLLTNLLPKEYYDRDDKNRLSLIKKLENIERFTNIEKIPDDIVDIQKRLASNYCSDIFYRNDKYVSLSSYEKRIFEKTQFVTNHFVKLAATLSDPLADPDEDGFNNAKEAECDTNPLYYNELAICPHRFRVDPQGNSIVTGFFSVINNSQTNYQVYLQISDYSNDLYKPRLLLTKTGYKTKTFDEILSFDIASRSEEKIGFLAQTDCLPSYLSTSISCYVKRDNLSISKSMFDLIGEEERKKLNKKSMYVENDMNIGKIYPVLVNYECALPSKPIIISPADGARFSSIKEINFKWKDTDTKNKCDGDKASLFAKAYWYDEQNRKVKPCDYISNVSNARAKLKIDVDFYEFYVPGIFFWRVGKKTESKCVSYSKWNWFVIGKEVAPIDKATLKLKKDVVIHKILLPESKNDYFYWDHDFCRDYINLEEKKPYFGKQPFKMHFIEPLPKGIVQKIPKKIYFYPFYIEASTNNFILPGTYTNHLVVSNGQTVLTNKHIFIIKRKFN
ncbi:hypothetical protein J6U78_05960 [bacterium]|nr:hypothetical protein [bacterium]